MRTASWAELDVDANCYGIHQPATGWVSDCNCTLGGVRDTAAMDNTTPTFVVAWLGGEHVLVPEGNPPPSFKVGDRVVIEGVVVETNTPHHVHVRVRSDYILACDPRNIRLAEGGE